MRLSTVMSSSLCKQLEGTAFPFQIESLENRADDSIHTLEVHKSHRGPGSPARSVDGDSFRHRCREKTKNDCSSGESRCRRRTIDPTPSATVSTSTKQLPWLLRSCRLRLSASYSAASAACRGATIQAQMSHAIFPGLPGNQVAMTNSTVLFIFLLTTSPLFCCSAAGIALTIITMNRRQPKSEYPAAPDRAHTGASVSGVVNAILEVGHERSALLAKLRSALQSGDNTQALNLARQFCGLPNEEGARINPRVNCRASG
jgi:hypothetical protein